MTCPPCTGTCRQGRDCPYVGREKPSKQRRTDQAWLVLLIAICWVFVPLLLVHLLTWAVKP